MASSLTASLSTGMKTFTDLPTGRQIAVIGMIAGGLVTAAAILFWALKPSYLPLFGQIEASRGIPGDAGTRSVGRPL